MELPSTLLTLLLSLTLVSANLLDDDRTTRNDVADVAVAPTPRVADVARTHERRSQKGQGLL